MAYHVWGCCSRRRRLGWVGIHQIVVDHVGQRKTMRGSFEYVASLPITTPYWLEKGEPSRLGFRARLVIYNSYGPLSRVLVFILVWKIQARWKFSKRNSHHVSHLSKSERGREVLGSMFLIELVIAVFDRVVEMECNPKANEELGQGGFEPSALGGRRVIQVKWACCPLIGSQSCGGLSGGDKSGSC